MNTLSLACSNLLRKRWQTLTTVGSVAVAFSLLAMLSGVESAFTSASGRLHTNILMVVPKFKDPLPVSIVNEVRKVPGVHSVAYQIRLGGYYQEPAQRFGGHATEPDKWFGINPQFVISPQHLEQLTRTRDGAAVSVALAKKYGWRVGDKFTLNNGPKRIDGTTSWPFVMVATFDNIEDPGAAEMFVANYVYIEESRLLEKGTVGVLTLDISDPAQATPISGSIDGLFLNSSSPTLTRTEKELFENELQQIGDVEFFTKTIGATIFAALLLLTVNSLSQSIRERKVEFATLKALGFTNMRLAFLVVAESLAIYAGGALIGLAVAKFVFPYFEKMVDVPRLPLTAYFVVLAIAVVASIATAILPLYRVIALKPAESLIRRS